MLKKKLTFLRENEEDNLYRYYFVAIALHTLELSKKYRSKQNVFDTSIFSEADFFLKSR